MPELADIHEIVEHLRKHTLGGAHDEEQVVDALVRVMDRRPDLRKLLKPGDVAFLRTKRKGRYAFDEVDEPEEREIVEVVIQEPPMVRAAQYARDWNDLRATGRNVTRDEITAAASDLAGTGHYVAWNASDESPGWEVVPATVVDAVMGRYARDGEPGGGVMFGGEVHTGDDEQERIHLIADILHGVYGDDVMSMFDEPGRYSREPEGRYAKWGPEEAAQHPRGANGQFVKRGTGEAATMTREKVRDALKGGGTAKELAGHLDLLTVKQLAEIKKEYQISASGRNKAELVAKLAERLSKGRGDGEAPTGESPSYADWGKGERESRKETVAEPEAKPGEKPQEGAKGKEPHEMTADEWNKTAVMIRGAHKTISDMDNAIGKIRSEVGNKTEAARRAEPFRQRKQDLLDGLKASGVSDEMYALVAYNQGDTDSQMQAKVIQSALASGKPVPDAVLADYPDLAAKYGRGKEEGAMADDSKATEPKDKESKSDNAPAMIRHSLDVEKKSIFADGLKRSKYPTMHQSIAMASLKGADAIWHHQGDPQQALFNAAQTGAKEWDLKRAEEIKAAYKAGYRLSNHKAGKYGTLYVFEKDGRVLTERGAKALVEGTGTIDLPHGTTRETAKPVIDAVHKFVKGLPETTKNNLGAIVKAVNQSPLGKHVELSRGQDGYLSLKSKTGSWSISEPVQGHDAKGVWHKNLESSLPRFLEKIAHLSGNEIGKEYGDWAIHDRAADSHAVGTDPAINAT